MTYTHRMLPLSQTYDQSAVEKKWQDHWLANRTYAWNPEIAREDSYVIDTPPPTVSGTLHMGHVFSYTQADFIARFQRMNGKNVFYPMGFDDNGLPTERLVEKTKKIRAVDMSREAFIAQCMEVSEEARKEFRALFESIALSVDWDQEYHTISEDSRRLSQLSFLDLVNKGEVYRKQQPMLWDPVDQTAIAQAEVEDKMLASHFTDIAFTCVENGEELVIGTTRPELLPACVALFYHPDDARYQHLAGKHASVPLFAFSVPILTDESVEPEKGTGLMMCCTFGDEKDIEKWRKHNLPMRMVINKFGKMNFYLSNPTKAQLSFKEFPAEVIDTLSDDELKHFSIEFFESGAEEMFSLDSETSKDFKTAFKTITQIDARKISNTDPKHLGARETILALLKDAGLIRLQTAITHAVKCAERSGAALELIPTAQWFVKVVDKKDALKNKAAQCAWNPDWMRLRIEQWIDGLNWDWCISRQRYFGVPFPVWYSLREGEIGKAIYASPEQLPCNPLVDLPAGYTREEVTADADVMDTWATSSISPQLSAGAISSPDAGHHPHRLRGGIEGGEPNEAPDYGYFGKDSDTTRNQENLPCAKEMRECMTRAEFKLWNEVLSGKKLEGVKFRRQQTIGNYIVDFVSMQHKLVIELDGSQHADIRKTYDDARTVFLENAGYRVIRFWNNDVLENLEGVYTAIAEALQLPPLVPPASGGDGALPQERNKGHDRFAKLFPADLRPQAHEIIRTWAFYTLVKSHLHNDSIPWHNLMISGWCLAEDKSKMSKSKGNVVTPVALIEERGTDAVRYWAATSRLGADTAFSPDLLKIGKKLVGKLWNATQFAAIHLSKMNAEPTSAASDTAIVETLDRWILSRLHETVARATEAFARYEYADALDATNQFFWADFCDNYLELIKKRVYNEDGSASPAAQQSAVRTLYYVLDGILKLYAPFTPHVTEELYAHIFTDSYAAKGSLHAMGMWPKAADYLLDAEALTAGAHAVAMLEIIRKEKSQRSLSIKAPVKILTLYAASQQLRDSATRFLPDVLGAGNISSLEFSSDEANLSEMIVVPSEQSLTLYAVRLDFVDEADAA